MLQKTPMNEDDSKPDSPYEAPSRLSSAIRWFREQVGSRSEGNLKELIEEALDSESSDVSAISAEEKSLLKNMIHFGELTVHDVMIPRSDIMGIRRDESMEDLKNHVIEIGHTRIPVYDDSLDHIEGFIHVKDLFPYMSSGKEFRITQLMRDILFVPPSMRIVDLLLKMRVSGIHIAIVVDEYGGTDGLITMEDLFEELVGEIQDEHDGYETNAQLRWMGDHVVEMDARATIEQLEQALGESVCAEPEECAEVDTIGGLIIQMLGRVPVRGEVVVLKPTIKAEVLTADPRRIRQVRLTRLSVAAPVTIVK